MIGSKRCLIVSRNLVGQLGGKLTLTLLVVHHPLEVAQTDRAAQAIILFWKAVNSGSQTFPGLPITGYPPRNDSRESVHVC